MDEGLSLLRNVQIGRCVGLKVLAWCTWYAMSDGEWWVYVVQPNYSLRTFTGHQTSVMSLDFHPNTEDLLCSCDGDSEIRYWSVNQGVCTRVFKVCDIRVCVKEVDGRM